MRKSIFITPLLASATMVTAAAERPNVLLILADDMGYECLGANGSTYLTPNLDKMALEGVRFENCHAQPLSTPTRVELMTGLYNNRNYVNFGVLDPEQRTFGNMAKEQGYKTCIAGKWQLGTDKSLPAHFGFDNYCLWQLSSEKNAKGSRYAAPLYDVDGETVVGDIETYGPDIYSDYICDFIDKNSREPMFIYYPMALIHTPVDPTPDSREWQDKSTRTVTLPKDRTVDMVAYADEIVAKLIKKLDDKGILDNTVILFVGDNGTNSGVHTKMQDGRVIQGGKRRTTKNGTNVPMIVRWGDRIKGGEVNENLVDVSDFYPTLRDIIKGDEKLDRKLDGISFYGQLVGDKKAEVREWSMCHYPEQKTPSNYIRFVQTKDYKLYTSGRFYNTRNDFYEKKNILKGGGTAEQESIRKMLQKALDSFPHGSEIIKKSCTDITQ